MLPETGNIEATYAPSTNVTAEEQQTYLDDLEALLAHVKARHILIIARDFNAEVGIRDQHAQVLGPHGPPGTYDLVFFVHTRGETEDQRGESVHESCLSLITQSLAGRLPTQLALACALSCLILADLWRILLSQTPRPFGPCHFRFVSIFAMLTFVIFLCICSVSFAFRYFGHRRRRRALRCRKIHDQRAPWPKRRKIRFYMNCLHICHYLMLLLMKAYGSSFVCCARQPHDSFASDQITTQKATCKVLKYGTQLFRVHRRWFINRLTQNKLTHILYGNMQSNRKGSSKGKKGADRDSVIDPDEAFRLEISSSLPEAAMIRTQPRLFDADWNVPCRNALELSSDEEVAIANKTQVPAILRRVGYTRNRVAILTTQSAQDLHLKGYPSQQITVRVQVLTDEGDRKEIHLQRFLIQLGFGRHVQFSATGDLVSISDTMIKMTAKLPAFCGWSAETYRGNTFATILSEYIDIQLVESLQTRDGNSATFYAHQSVVSTLLQASGRNGMYIKTHLDHEEQFPMDLYWLPDHISMEEGLEYATHPSALGLVAKNSKNHPRFAVRFKDIDDIQEFTKKHGLPSHVDNGRWRLDGLTPAIGSAGAIQFLEAHGWIVEELLYFGLNHVVYTASKTGDTKAMHYKRGSSLQQLRFKALNRKARSEQQSTAGQTIRNSSTAKASGKGAQKRAELLRSLTSQGNNAAVPSPKSPPKQPEKRPPEGATGATPASKQRDRDI